MLSQPVLFIGARLFARVLSSSLSLSLVQPEYVTQHSTRHCHTMLHANIILSLVYCIDTYSALSPIHRTWALTLSLTLSLTLTVQASTSSIECPTTTDSQKQVSQAAQATYLQTSPTAARQLERWRIRCRSSACRQANPNPLSPRLRSRRQTHSRTRAGYENFPCAGN